MKEIQILNTFTTIPNLIAAIAILIAGHWGAYRIVKPRKNNWKQFKKMHEV